MNSEESIRITREQGWTGGHNPWLIAFVVSMATFMEILDTSIANVSLPHIAGNLSASQDESTWVITSYLMANAIVLPISGWLSNRIGRKRYYMGSVMIFILSSFMCGIAPNLGALIFFRIVQGIGGGGLGPSEQAILADTFPQPKRAMGIAVYGMAVVIAPAIGPTLGGFITDSYSWRWIFFINIPVGILSLLLSSRLLVDPPHLVEAKKRVGPIDTIGLSLIAVGLGAMEYVLDKGQEDDWFASSAITLFTIVAAVVLVSFVLWEWRQEHPVVEVKLFRDKSFAVSSLLMLTLGIAIYAPTVLLPQYTQLLMGWSSLRAGMALSPGAVVMIFLFPLAGILATKVDARILIACGFGAISLGLYNIATTLYPGIDFSTAVWLRIEQMVGAAFIFVSINAVAYAGVSPAKSNQVSGIINLMRNVGGDLGIAFVTTLIARRAQMHQERLTAHLDAANPLLASRLDGVAHSLQRAGMEMTQATQSAVGIIYKQLIQQAETLAYLDAFFVLACILAVMVPAVLLTKRVRPGATAAAGAH
jgi:DHA2 family multidrug resistance protein